MIPVLLHLSFATSGAQLTLYLCALAGILYAAFTGWQSAQGPRRADGSEGPPEVHQRLGRAALFTGVALVLARMALYFALPSTAFLGDRGEGFALHTYGLMLALGFTAAVMVATRTAQQEWPGAEGRLRREQILDLSFWVLLSAILGSKLLYTLVNWQEYAGHLGESFTSLPRFLDFIGGGVVFQGGLLGATLVSYLWARRVKINFLRLADVCIPTVSLGGAFGRLGCFSAGCCWGKVAAPGFGAAVHFPGARLAHDLFGRDVGTASLAYGSQVLDPRWVVPATGKILHEAAPGAVRISDWVMQHGTTLGLHPTQLYDSGAHLLMFFALMALRPYRRFHGMIFGLWLVGYAFQRSLVELFRGDLERGTLHGLLESLGASSLAARVPPEAWFNVSTAQFISFCMLTGGAALLVWGFRKHARALPLTPSAALAV